MEKFEKVDITKEQQMVNAIEEKANKDFQDNLIDLDAVSGVNEVADQPEVEAATETTEEKQVIEDSQDQAIEAEGVDSVDTVEDIIEIVDEKEELTVEQPEKQYELPENLQKLVDFMNETGGTLEDFVGLNKDFDSFSDDAIVKEYYKQKYPHYTASRLERKMNKDFSYDAEVDDPDEIQDKKDLFEDTLFEAKSYLKDRKEKYYAELKANGSATSETKSAYNAEMKDFESKTNDVFGEDFKGWTIDLDGQKVLYKVGDKDKVKADQLTPQGVFSEYVKDGELIDAKAFHKSMYFAKHGETVAKRMYEKGKADAIKEQAMASKGVDLTATAQDSGSTRKKPGQFERVSPRSSNKLRVNPRFTKK